MEKYTEAEMTDFRNLVDSKTLEEWAALNTNEEMIFPENRAPYAFKIFQRKVEINNQINELKEELDALSRL